MTAEQPFLTDEAIDVLVRGDETGDPTLAPLAEFSREVRGLGDRPAPAPSSALAAALAGQPLTGPSLWSRARHAVSVRWTRTVGWVAGLGAAAKVALATSLAAAGTAGATAAGVLPEPIDDAVRDVVEAVTPFELHEGSDEEPERGRDPDSVPPTTPEPGGGSPDDTGTSPDDTPTPTTAIPPTVDPTTAPTPPSIVPDAPSPTPPPPDPATPAPEPEPVSPTHPTRPEDPGPPADPGPPESPGRRDDRPEPTIQPEGRQAPPLPEARDPH